MRIEHAKIAIPLLLLLAVGWMVFAPLRDNHRVHASPLPATGKAIPVPGAQVPVQAASAPTPHPVGLKLPWESCAEPTVGQVQQAAIRYAEVSPQKISRWRAQARWKAFLPKLTLSLDRDQSANIASSTYKGVTQFTIGPNRRNFSVDFDFTWDLGDLLWSTDQTSIDVRSRLMVKLRNEILEEVTQIYFERKELLKRFRAAPTEDPILAQERRLRIEALTAHLDAFTGGYFSAQLTND